MRTSLATETIESLSEDPYVASWAGFPGRLTQVLANARMSQTELARGLKLSAGFMSEVMRGMKRPGPDFFIGIRDLLGISADWLLTGEGAMSGGMGVRQDLFQAVQLQIAVARAAIVERDPVAKALLLLIREGRMDAIAADPDFSELLDRVAPQSPDLDLAIELYNGHLATTDPIAQRRNILAAATAHFETRRPTDRMAAFTGIGSTTVQHNTGAYQRISGHTYIEHQGPPPASKKRRS